MVDARGEESGTIEDSRALARYQRQEGASAYAGKYERSYGRRRTDRAERALMQRMLGRLDPAASLLNVACGAGRFSDILLAGRRARVTYVDFSAAMLEEAGARVRALGHHEVEFRQADATADAPPEPHDLVVNVRMLHHLKEEGLRARALDFLCQASTDALLFTVASDATFRGWRRRRRAARRQRGEHVVSLAELGRELEARGFEIVDVGYVSRLFSSQTWVLARRGSRT